MKSYQSWMSTSELNSNGENDKEPAEKDASTIPCRYKTHFKREEVVSNGINLNRGFIYSRSAIKEGGRVEEQTTLVQLQYCGRNTLIIQCTNRGKNEKKDEAIDHH
ncbi:hypothetical protein F511_46673 [Dorcoceras hygrometricum]|uniref:Uncharacterized protein n=1 Tax=Dorcoceras hygrometricum TaxID=472368 RepID=A0A2Z6ZZR0_9LAMI|nr:hypothetical protein F511_46673 [Dorcoceras hygrometricum]